MPAGPRPAHRHWSRAHVPLHDARTPHCATAEHVAPGARNAWHVVPSHQLPMHGSPDAQLPPATGHATQIEPLHVVPAMQTASGEEHAAFASRTVWQVPLPAQPRPGWHSRESEHAAPTPPSGWHAPVDDWQ